MKTIAVYLFVLTSVIIIPVHALGDDNALTADRSKRVGTKIIKRALVPIYLISTAQDATAAYEETGNANDTTKKLIKDEVENWEQIGSDIGAIYEYAKPQVKENATKAWSNIKPMINDGTSKALESFDNWMSKE
jgi:hypothetical protein